MNYVQLLFSYFNAPLFATFVIGLFWRRATRWGGFAGLVAGTLGAFLTHFLYSKGTIDIPSPLAADFWGAIVAFSADAIVTVVVSLMTQPRREEDLQDLVWGMANVDPDAKRERPWWQRPVVLAVIVLVIAVILNIIFI
jgi:SSS family solute:Na+ symporter